MPESLPFIEWLVLTAKGMCKGASLTIFLMLYHQDLALPYVDKMPNRHRSARMLSSIPQILLGVWGLDVNAAAAIAAHYTLAYASCRCAVGPAKEPEGRGC